MFEFAYETGDFILVPLFWSGSHSLNLVLNLKFLQGLNEGFRDVFPLFLVQKDLKWIYGEFYKIPLQTVQMRVLREADL